MHLFGHNVDHDYYFELLREEEVAREAPFHFTTAPDTKPVPFIVSMNFPLPGATFAGTKG
jgi:hypothetical protein